MNEQPNACGEPVGPAYDIALLKPGRKGQELLSPGGAFYRENDALRQPLLSDGGGIEEYGWLKDKFGILWQIAPTKLDERLSG